MKISRETYLEKLIAAKGDGYVKAIASYLDQGRGLDESIKLAKAYITKAIQLGKDYSIGGGHGPVKHFF